MFSFGFRRARSFAKRSAATALFATLASAGLVGATASSAHAFITQWPPGCRGAAYGTFPQSDWRHNCWLGQSPSLDNQSEYVTGVQVILNDLHINTGGIDGVFGPQTRNAVIWFQATHGMTRDGMVGADTWQRLGQQLVPQGRGTTCVVGCRRVWWFGVRRANGSIDSHRFFSIDDPNPIQRGYWFDDPTHPGWWYPFGDFNSLVS